MRLLPHFLDLELADALPLAEVGGRDAVLEEEEEVPLRGAVVLRLEGPEEVSRSGLVGVHLGVDESGQSGLVGVVHLVEGRVVDLADVLGAVGGLVGRAVTAVEVLLAVAVGQRPLADERGKRGLFEKEQKN